MPATANVGRFLTGLALVVMVGACSQPLPTATPAEDTPSPPTAPQTEPPASPQPTSTPEPATATASPESTASPSAAATTAPATAIPTAGEAVRRIRFAPGGTSANVEGDLLPAGSVLYVLAAQAGQTLYATVTATNGPVALSIFGADGTVLISPMGGVDRWSGVLPRTQDYYVDVRGAPDMAIHYLLSVSIPPLATPDPGVQRIAFPPGGTQASRQGHLGAGGTDRYVLGASAGQTMEVIATTDTGAVRLVIYGADGSVLASGMASTDHWKGPLPFTQDYFIDVQASPEGEASYRLTVIIPPG